MKQDYTTVKKNHPFLLYKFPNFQLFENNYSFQFNSAQTLEVSNKNPHFLLTELQRNEINKYLKEVFEVQKPFIQTQYNLSQLSQESGFSRNIISAFLNQVLFCCFNDYINLLRIKYCQQLIADGYANLLTLKGLAERCGFYNRNTFTTAFKKFMGVTPSQYIKVLSMQEVM